MASARFAIPAGIGRYAAGAAALAVFALLIVGMVRLANRQRPAAPAAVVAAALVVAAVVVATKLNQVSAAGFSSNLNPAVFVG